MLSRRNVRIKILQLLYCRSIIPELSQRDLIARYRNMLDNSYDLYLLSLYIILEVTRQSVADQKNRTKKHLPSEEDQNFKPRLFTNDLIQSLETNEGLQNLFIQLEFRESVDKDLVRQIYKSYLKEEKYIQYATASKTTDDEDREALLELFRFLRKNELFEEILEDKYHAWLDDKSLVIGSIKKTIKALPEKGDFFDQYRPEDETTEDFGMNLLIQTLTQEDKTLERIQPKLENWEADRLATIDMVILKMAVAELLTFSSIPTKATINEYVEIAKNYSTEKSKEFVNGVLDTLMKELEAEGIIVKSGRGLK